MSLPSGSNEEVFRITSSGIGMCRTEDWAAVRRPYSRVIVYIRTAIDDMKFGDGDIEGQHRRRRRGINHFSWFLNTSMRVAWSGGRSMWTSRDSSPAMRDELQVYEVQSGWQTGQYPRSRT